MERHPKQLHVRMSDREMESAKGLARGLGMTVSDLIRVLLQLPAEEVRGGARLVVVDRTTAARLSREMTRWGHHYNQAVHALNAIAYYLRANDMETAEVVEELSRAERKLCRNAARGRVAEASGGGALRKRPRRAGEVTGVPMLKTISGHTSAKGIRRYLTKEGRALAEDYINLELPAPGRPFDWAEAMDRTRRLYGNDSAWRGRRARTYKHYVVSPDPKDRISLDGLRALATGWARKCFPDHEVAIVYHDDNAGGIPHAHVVVNNTNLETGRRLQDPDPKALARSLQGAAESLGMSPLEAVPRSGVAARAERRRPRPAASTRREENVGRAEKELSDRGEYSWVADIRARVRVARSVARSETEFRSLLGSLGVTVSENSPHAPRRDWVYAFADRPSRRVSGERLGLSYSRERLEPVLRTGGFRRIADAGERAIAAAARSAVELGDLEELRTLSEAVALVESSRATCVADLDRLAMDARGAELAAYARRIGMLPEQRPEPRLGAKPSKSCLGRVAGNRGSRGIGSAETPRTPERQERGKQR